MFTVADQPLNVSSLVAWLRGDGRQIFKYLIVGAASVVIGSALLAFLLFGLDLRGVRANMLSAAIMVMPNYVANRYWVWGKRSRNSFRTEVLPFWLLAILGFLVSTGGAWLVDDYWGWPKFVVLIANVFSYGLVWVFKYVVLNRFLFGSDPISTEA